MHVKAILSTISSSVRPISKLWKIPRTTRLQREHVGKILLLSPEGAPEGAPEKARKRPKESTKLFNII
jgi:hypothetical protein